MAGRVDDDEEEDDAHGKLQRGGLLGRTFSLLSRAVRTNQVLPLCDGMSVQIAPGCP